MKSKTGSLATGLLFYLAPVLALVSFLLNLFVILAPTLMFKDSVSLARIHPALIDFATKTATKSKDVDGPSVMVGFLGSCARRNSAAPLWCTTPSFAATYNTTVLPSSVPAFLTAPVAATPLFALLALVVLAIFVPVFTLFILNEKLPASMGKIFGRRVVACGVVWSGLLSWMVLTTVYLVMRMWLGRAVEDTNLLIFNLGKNAPQLQAEIANGFTLVWVAQAFAVVPFICALMKHQHTNAPAGKA